MTFFAGSIGVDLDSFKGAGEAFKANESKEKVGGMSEENRQKIKQDIISKSLN